MASADAFLRTTGRFAASRIPVQLAGRRHKLFRATAIIVVVNNEELALASDIPHSPGRRGFSIFPGSISNNHG